MLRGPQGLLRGLSAPSGTITIATKRPVFDQVEGYAQASATNRAGYNFQGGVTLPFSDKLSIRVAGLVDGNRLNNVRNITRGGEYSRSRTESARITVGWQPSDTFTAYLTYQYLHADNTQHQQVIGAGSNPVKQATLPVGGGAVVIVPTTSSLRSGPALDVEDYAAVAGGRNRFLNNSHFVSLNADWDLGPATLSFIGGYQYATLDQFRDLDAGNAVPNMTLPRERLTHVTNPIKSAELRLSSNNTGDGFGWGVSAFYTKRGGIVSGDDLPNYNFSQFTTDFNEGLYTATRNHLNLKIKSSDLSFSASARFKSGPFRVEGGIRKTISKGDQGSSITIAVLSGKFPFAVGGGAYFLVPLAPGAPFTLPLSPGGTRKFTPWTGGANVSYEITPDVNVYASYGRAFRSGSVAVGVPAGTAQDLVIGGNETTDSFEVGFKGSALDRRLSFSAAVFYQKFKGYLSRFDGIFYNCPDVSGSCNSNGPAINNATDNPPANGVFSFNNNADATVKGAEIMIDARPIDNWDIGVSASYAKGRYDNASIPCNDFSGDGIPDQVGTPRVSGSRNISFCPSNGRIAEIPDFSLTANSELRFPMGALTPFARTNVSYRPGFHSDLADYTYQSTTLVNLYIGIRGEDSKWELTGFVKNLLNQQRIRKISLGNAFTGPYDSGYKTVNVTNPREFGASMNYKF